MVIKLTLVFGIPFPFFFAHDSVKSAAIIMRLQNAMIITLGRTIKVVFLPHRPELTDVLLNADLSLEVIKRLTGKRIRIS